MKLILLSLLITTCIGSLSKKSIIQELEGIDAKFKLEGPSLDILQDYDSILRNLKSLGNEVDINLIKRIGNVQFKHGLINYSLDRENLAWIDYKTCSNIEINGLRSFHKQCFNKFVDLSISLGKIDDLRQMSNSLGNELDNLYEVNEKINWFEINNSNLDQLIANREWKNALEVCNEMLEISYGNSNLLNKKLSILKNTLNDPSLSFDSKVRDLIDVYSKLIKYSPNDLKSYSEVSKLKMFDQFSKKGESTKLLKECLRIDNEFKECRTISRVNIKLNQLLDLIRDVSDYHSSVYSDGELEWIKDKEFKGDEWERIYEMLFYSVKKVKIKNGLDRSAFVQLGVEDIDNIKTNFEVIIELFVGSMKDFGFEENEIVNSGFMSNLFRLAREAYYQNGEIRRFKKDGIVTTNKYYKQVRQNNKGEKDVVDYAVELDKLIAKNDIGKLKEVIGLMSESLKTTRVLAERVSKFEEMQQMENQKRQQHQRERYQQQHYQQQQQRQQKQKPANDYYKVLGIDSKADETEIKKAYREKMRQNHPDKMRGSELSEEEIENKVAEINNAYEVLSDPEQKEKYDLYGEDPNDSTGGSRAQPQGNPFGGFGGAGGGGFNFGGFNFGQQQFHFQRG